MESKKKMMISPKRFDPLRTNAISERMDAAASAMDAFVPHRALPNRSGQVRWSVVVWMMSA